MSIRQMDDGTTAIDLVQSEEEIFKLFAYEVSDEALEAAGANLAAASISNYTSINCCACSNTCYEE
jgi:hypothetical protein